MAHPADIERVWLEQWRGATVALAAQRRHELQIMTADRALAASDALLSLASTQRLSVGRLTNSGLVEQQSFFHRRGR